MFKCTPENVFAPHLRYNAPIQREKPHLRDERKLGRWAWGLLKTGDNMLGRIDNDDVVFQSKLSAIIMWLLLVLVLSAVAICFVWLGFALPDVTHKNSSYFTYCMLGALMFGAMLIAILYTVTPFYLSVNLTKRTYHLARGIRPFAFHCSGNLSEIKELRVERNSTQGGVFFRMALIWKKWGRSPVYFDAIKDENKAYDLIQEAADILRVPPSSLSA